MNPLSFRIAFQLVLCVLPRWQQVDKHARYSRAFGDGLMIPATAASLINHVYAPSVTVGEIRWER